MECLIINSEYKKHKSERIDICFGSFRLGLRPLGCAGLIIRKVHVEVPRKGEYSLREHT